MADLRLGAGREGFLPPRADRVGNAVRRLSPPDHRRLIAYGCVLCNRSTIVSHDGQDLFQEAIERALSSDRDWPSDVPFLKFLFGTMKSIADSWRRDPYRARRVHESADSDDDVAPVSLIDNAESGELPPDVKVMRDEIRQILIQALSEEKTKQVLSARLSGLKRAEIMKHVGLTLKQYETIYKRLKRKLGAVREAVR